MIYAVEIIQNGSSASKFEIEDYKDAEIFVSAVMAVADCDTEVKIYKTESEADDETTKKIDETE